MVGSLFRGRDASFPVSAFVEATVLGSEDTWCLGKGRADSDPELLMLGQHASHH